METMKLLTGQFAGLKGLGATFPDPIDFDVIDYGGGPTLHPVDSNKLPVIDIGDAPPIPTSWLKKNPVIPSAINPKLPVFAPNAPKLSYGPTKTTGSSATDKIQQVLNSVTRAVNSVFGGGTITAASNQQVNGGAGLGEDTGAAVGSGVGGAIDKFFSLIKAHPTESLIVGAGLALYMMQPHEKVALRRGR